MSRPTGVTILAVLSFLGACCFILFGILALLGGVVAAIASIPFLALLAGGGAIGAAIFCFVAAALSIWIGMGLLRLRNAARILTLVFVGLSLLASVLGLASSLLRFDLPSAVVRLIIGAIDIWIVAYLFKPQVKQVFGATGF